MNSNKSKNSNQKVLTIVPLFIRFICKPFKKNLFLMLIYNYHYILNRDVSIVTDIHYSSTPNNNITNLPSHARCLLLLSKSN